MNLCHQVVVVRVLLLLLLPLHAAGVPTTRKTTISYATKSSLTTYSASKLCFDREWGYLPSVESQAKYELYKSLAEAGGTYSPFASAFWTIGNPSLTNLGYWYWDNYPSCSPFSMSSSIWADTSFSLITFCSSLEFSGTSYGLVPRSCQNELGVFVCERIDEENSCEFNGVSENSRPTSVTSQIVQYSSMAEEDNCRNLCSTHTDPTNPDAECWGYVYFEGPSRCELYVHVNPWLLKVQETTTESCGGCIYVEKNCYNVQNVESPSEAFTCPSHPCLLTRRCTTSGPITTAAPPTTVAQPTTTVAPPTTTAAPPTTTAAPPTTTMAPPTTTAAPPTTTAAPPTTTSAPPTTTAAPPTTTAGAPASTVSPPVTTPENTIRIFIWPCFCASNSSSNISVEEKIEEIVQELTVETKSTSSYTRTLTCAKDERASAKSIGAVGIIIFATIFGMLLILDLTNICHRRNNP